MAWGTWPRKHATDPGTAVAGLDINATRARGAVTSAGTPPRPLLLADPEEELPLAISLEGRAPQVGPAALAFRRAAPHQLCAGFLPMLGQPKVWSAGRHKLDASTALAHVASALKNTLTEVGGIEVCLPAYLSSSQTKLVRSALESARMPLLGTISLPLALAALNPDAPRGLSMVLDADDQIATWSLIATDGKHHQIKAVIPLPNSGIRSWVDRLVELVSDRCVRLCRRDPRDSAMAEQSLDEQLSEFLQHPRPGQPLALSLRTEHWFQNLVVTWDDISKACLNSARAIADGGRNILNRVSTASPPEVVWVTSAAAKLPSLLDCVGLRLPERTSVLELSPVAGAEAALALAVRRLRGELPGGDLRDAVPRLQTANVQPVR